MSDWLATVTEQELLELRGAFQLYEEQSEDGRVDAAGLGRLLRSLGHSPTDTELDENIAELSADGADTLEFPDFLKLLGRKMKERDSDSELRAAFEVLDEEGSGRVTAEELRGLLVEMVGEQGEEVDAMLKEAKVDKEGFINYEDFITLVMS